MKQLRRRAGALGPREQAVGDAALGVGFEAVRERKEVDREEDVEELQRIARRLAETMIERSAARAAHLIEHAVEDFPSLLVGVEALVKKVAQKASALRHAPGEREPHAGHGI